MRESFWKESERAGNPAFDPNADWVDYELAGATGPADLLPCMVRVLKQVELDEDIYSLGLRGTVDAKLRPDLAEKILKARHTLHEHLQDGTYAGLVEPFNKDHYNKNLSVAENLLFGTALGKQFDGDNLAADPYVLSVLKETGLDLELQRMGLTIAETMVELFSGLSPTIRCSSNTASSPPTSCPTSGCCCSAWAARASRRCGGRPHPAHDPAVSLHRGAPSPRPDRRGDGGAHPRRPARVLPKASPTICAAVEFYDFERYNSAATLQDNILFGRLVYGQAQAGERIGTLIAQVFDELGLRDSVIEVGLEYNVGVGGKRLPASQRQKLGIARALIKRPELMVVNEAVAMFDGRTQDRIRDNILAGASEGNRGVFWIANRPSQAEPFEKIVVMQGGRVVAQGSPSELAAKGGLYAELMASA